MGLGSGSWYCPLPSRGHTELEAIIDCNVSGGPGHDTEETTAGRGS